MQIEINFVTSMVVTLMMLACVRAYWHLFRVERGTWGFYMVRAMVLGSTTAILRTNYWAVTPFFVDDTFAALFNIPLIFAAYYVLCSRLVLIPEDERDRWRWWNAWLHPNGLRLRLRSRPFK